MGAKEDIAELRAANVRLNQALEDLARRVEAIEQSRQSRSNEEDGLVVSKDHEKILLTLAKRDGLVEGTSQSLTELNTVRLEFLLTELLYAGLLEREWDRDGRPVWSLNHESRKWLVAHNHA